MSDLENSACTGSCDTCGSDCNLDLSNPNATVTLTLDDDSELVCAVLTIFPAGEHKYIALLPLDENGENQDGEVFLYRFFQEEGQQPTLENIEDDDEYEDDDDYDDYEEDYESDEDLKKSVNSDTFEMDFIDFD